LNIDRVHSTVMASPAVTRLPLHNSLSASIAQHDAVSKPQTAPLNPGPASSHSGSSSSSPDSRPVDLRSPIPEEEEDETSSETANEPVTPTDLHHTHDFHHNSHEPLHEDSHVTFHPVQSTQAKPPILLNTAPTPPPASPATKNPATCESDQQPPQTPSQTRPTSSREPGIKRGFSQFFRRSNSHMATPTSAIHNDVLTHGAGGSETMLIGGQQRLSSRRMSATPSPNTTRSNSPPSPASPEEMTIRYQITAPDPIPSQFLNAGKKNRSSTGLGLRNKFHGITFAATTTQKKPHPVRHRATSVDRETGIQAANKSSQPELTRHPWGFPAEAGTGLKARRMSLNLPDDFTVDVVELHSEFADQSRIIGRRGKTLGKGATSTVRLMVRKGGSSELYAVKEFRGKQQNEKEEDYEKKVKSEYSIAKSLHHPNIVGSVRLCTHQSRWNHVMEYCQEGDLFNLVQKGYLTKDDRSTDRTCLFKQLIQGVHYLHNHGIAHRDIKLENLLITSQSKLKITDFGVSEVFSGIHPGLRAAGGQCGKDMNEVRLCAPGICGSMPYIAPEVVVKTGKK
jgi:protein-serine/threonine kinase